MHFQIEEKTRTSFCAPCVVKNHNLHRFKFKNENSLKTTKQTTIKIEVVVSKTSSYIDSLFFLWKNVFLEISVNERVCNKKVQA